MSKTLMTTAAALLITAPAAFAQMASTGIKGIAYVDGSVTTESPLIDQAAAINPTDADALITSYSSAEPVVIQGGKVLSDAQPIDMDLTAVPNTEFTFTNAAGQVVIMVPAGRDVAVVDK
ncbi:hypothetical protein JANAI62_22660 [Jannaschia pagri]|uniref:DUF1236 domain-containing protein n=1 Tax=Jannaschia pagri TaxID=2829797 RepID=A0ABQ4NMM8_9RHOB|nr:MULTISPECIES: hypothetical protein [unclassified Jannaschia]GIT91809.1 hypothetical protein JANAI61_22670 [Jannaschia sp. AI_61]GIT95643.1 hypothetical protein JANAI62_22660 [Jannaschia sp. AI_62]